LLIALNVRHDGKSSQALQESLRNHITATRYNGQLPVLLVDDTHVLPLATLKFIVELATQGEPLTRMRVVLLTEPQLTQIFATPEFTMVKNNLIHTIDVPTFSQTQVRDYLQFRLQNSKYRHVNPFNSSEMIKKIYLESDGVPGNINVIAQRLLRQFVAERLPVTHFSRNFDFQNKWLSNIKVVFVLIGILLLVYWWSFPGDEKNNSNNHLEENSQPHENDLFAHAQPVETFIPTESSNEQDSLKSAFLPFSATTYDNNISDSSETTLPQLLVKQTNAQIKGEQWLRQQNPKAYTLQVIGAYDIETLKKFLVRHPLTDIAFFKTTYRNRDWYVLVHGIYSNRREALAAREQLPASLRQSTQPWIRTLGSVQKVIRR
jgi:DamX protein